MILKGEGPRCLSEWRELCDVFSFWRHARTRRPIQARSGLGIGEAGRLSYIYRCVDVLRVVLVPSAKVAERVHCLPCKKRSIQTTMYLYIGLAFARA